MFGLTAAFFDEQIISFFLGKTSVVGIVEHALDEIADELIRGLIPEAIENPAGAIAERLQEIFIKEKPTDRRGAAQWHRASAQWRAGGWAASRKEWLAEKWRHDWRSQPRDMEGRWVPGRVDYNEAPNWRMSERQRRASRLRRAYRRAGRQSIKGYYGPGGRINGS